MVDIKDGANYAPTSQAEKVVAPGQFKFAAAYLDHGHINGQCNGLRDAGGECKVVFDTDTNRIAKFKEQYPNAKVAGSFEEILQNKEIKLVASAAIPNKRAEIGERVLKAGKDYFTDKSPFTTLSQLDHIKQVVKQTRQKYMVYYAERLHNDAAWQAGELIKQNAIGKVLHVTTLAPHRLAKDTRPNWFFDKEAYGGILTDIGSHQVEQFLTFAGCSDATISNARVANFSAQEKTGLEDFGEMNLIGDNGASFYTRVDWLTPNGLRTWGDGRTFIIGTEGTLELRKYIDVTKEAPASKIFLVNSDREQEIDCLGNSGFPYFGQLILDCIHRTENATTQAHDFKAAELSMRAQAIADEASPKD